MNIICIIPARGGSKGIPKKNLIDFCGKPLLAWSILQATESKLAKDVYVSSDSDEILSVAKAYGAKTIKRPDEVSTDTSTSESALLHTIDQIEIDFSDKIDLVVFLQATSPLRESKDIDGSIEKIIKDKADSLFSSALLEDYFIFEEKEGSFESVNFDYKNRSRRQDAKPQYLENGSIYIFKPWVLRDNDNRLGGNISTYEMEHWKSFEIDTMGDLELCEWYMKRTFLDSVSVK